MTTGPSVEYSDIDYVDDAHNIGNFILIDDDDDGGGGNSAVNENPRSSFYFDADIWNEWR